MTLNLKRPLAIFDLETTGVNVASDRIVEICILKVHPDGTKETKTHRINPERDIPLECSLIHGIYAEDVAEAPTFKELASDLAAFIGDADLGGFNSNKFDIPVLMEEFLRAGIPFDVDNRYFVDVQNIFHQMEQRTLKAAYKFYCEKELVNAHSAEADVLATFEILEAQVKRYEDREFVDKSGNVSTPVKNDVEALHSFTNIHKTVDFAGRMVYNNDGVEVFSFGKHKGKAVEEVFKMEPSYYAWMMRGDFPMYTKKCLEKIWTRYRLNQIKEANEAKKTKAVLPQPQAVPTRPQAEQRAPSTERTHQAKQEGPRNVNQKPAGKAPKARPISPDMLQSLKEKFGK